MRVGNLTFHFCHNYGAVLQSLALQQALLHLGVQAEIIDYNPVWKMTWIQRCGGLLSRRLGESLVDHLGERRFGAAHYRKFKAFRQQHLRRSAPYRSIRPLREHAKLYDALIVGSDQVWNWAWRWPVYFLNFATDYHGRRISYAACFGHDDQPADFLKRLPALLAPFNAISVRDKFSQDMVTRFCGREAQVVADPTLLVDLRAYERPPLIPLHHYILIYSMKTEEVESAAAVVASVKKVLNLPVVSVTPGGLRSSAFPGADETINDAGPAEWLWLFANASFVCTDSFHGSLFALKYRKPFVVFDHRSEASKRLYDFADRFAFRDRLVVEPAQLRTDGSWKTALGFDRIHERLDSHVRESFRFLETALQAEADPDLRVSASVGS